MISGTVLLFTLWLDRIDDFMLRWCLGCACAIESIMTINMFAKIYGAW